MESANRCGWFRQSPDTATATQKMVCLVDASLQLFHVLLYRCQNKFLNSVVDARCSERKCETHLAPYSFVGPFASTCRSYRPNGQCSLCTPEATYQDGMDLLEQHRQDLFLFQVASSKVESSLSLDKAMALCNMSRTSLIPGRTLGILAVGDGSPPTWCCVVLCLQQPQIHDQPEPARVGFTKSRRQRQWTRRLISTLHAIQFIIGYVLLLQNLWTCSFLVLQEVSYSCDVKFVFT